MMRFGLLSTGSRSAAILVASLLSSVASAADVFYWTGAESACWTNAANWVTSLKERTPAARCPGVVASGNDAADYAALHDDRDAARFEGAFTRAAIDLSGLFSIYQVTVSGAETPSVTFGTAPDQPLPIAYKGSFDVEYTVQRATRVPYGLIAGKGNNGDNRGYGSFTYPSFDMSVDAQEPLTIGTFFRDTKDPSYTAATITSDPRILGNMASGKGDIVFDCNLFDDGVSRTLRPQFQTHGTLTFNGDLANLQGLTAGGGSSNFVVAAGHYLGFKRGGQLNASAYGDVIFTGGGELRFSSSGTSGTFQRFNIDGDIALRFDGCTLKSVEQASGDDCGLTLDYVSESDRTKDKLYGTLDLAKVSDIAGPVKVLAPYTLRVSSIGAAGEPSSLGSGSEIVLGDKSALCYAGAGETTTRPLAFVAGPTGTAVTLRHEGTGTWRVGSPIATGSGDVALQLVSATDAAAVMATALGDPDGGRLSVHVSGSGAWTFDAANTFTGVLQLRGKAELGPNGTLGNPSELVSIGAALKIASVPGGRRTVDLPVLRFHGALNLEYDTAAVTVRIPSRAGTKPPFLRVNGAPAEVTADGEVKARPAWTGVGPDTPDWTKYPEKWVRVSMAFNGDNWPRISDILRRMANAGYNGVLLSNLDNLYYHPDYMFACLDDVIDLCDRLGIEIIPDCWNVGRGWVGATGLSNVEAYPIEDVPFEATANGRAVYAPNESFAIEDPSFDRSNECWEAKAAGVSYTNLVSWREYNNYHSGPAACFTLADVPLTALGNMMSGVSPKRTIHLKGGQTYQLSAFFRANGVANRNIMFIAAYYANGRIWTSQTFSTSKDETWERKALTLKPETDVDIIPYFGVYQEQSRQDAGCVWVDDVDVLCTTHRRGVVRREGLRFIVKSAADGTVYTEGTDYVLPASVATPIAVNGGPIHSYEITSSTPEIYLTLPAGSAIAEGEKLLVTYNAPFSWTGPGGSERQYAACMSNPGFYEDVRKSAETIFTRIAPRRWFLNIDEIRSGGTCDKCLEHESMAEILSGCINRMYGIIRAIDPGSDIVTWDDMLSPYANALEKYFDCRGSFVGVWNMIPKDILIMDWNITGTMDNPNIHLKESEDFFRNLGFRTLNAGYYDLLTSEKVQFHTRDQVRIMNTIPGALGFMYCTWDDPPHYEFLEEYSQIIDEAGKPAFLTCTWAGGAEGDWADAASWDNPPEPRAIVSIPAGTTVTLDAAALKTLQQIRGLAGEGRIVDKDGNDIPFERMELPDAPPDEPVEEDGLKFFADATNGNDDWDGTSAVHVDGTLVGPKKTVQAAVDLAVAGTNTIVTLAPGTYAEGGTVGTARVIVTKNDVTVRSATGRSEDVAIVGAFGAGENRTGTGATRCFAISGATNVVVQGITFRNGASSGNGGGLIGASANPQALTLIDCVVSNCYAKGYGGGAYGIIAHASRFTANCQSDTYLGGTAVAYCRLANCLVDHNRGTTYGNPLAYVYAAVNCTVIDNGPVGNNTLGTYVAGGKGAVYANTIVYGHSNNGSPAGYFRNCVLEGAEPRFFNDTAGGSRDEAITKSVTGDGVTKGQLVAPVFDDFHPLAGGVCAGRGDGAHLLQVPLPAGCVYHDLDGNPVPTNGAVTVGAYQTAHEQKAARIELGDDAILLDGAQRPAKKGDWIIPTSWPVTYRIGSTHGWNDTYAIIADGTDYCHLQYDGWVGFTPKPDATATHMLMAQKVAKHVYASPAGDDGNSGETPETAVKSLNKAYEKAKNTDFSVIHAANGDYVRESGAAAYVAVYNQSTEKAVGLRADEQGGAAIVGRADPDSGNVGNNAVRLTYLTGTAHGFVQGFVLREGYANTTLGQPQYMEGGSAIYATSNGKVPQILDCVVSNCWAKRIPAAWYTTIRRTRIVDNHALGGCASAGDDAGFVLQGSVLESCVLAGNDRVGVTDDKKASSFILLGATAYSCTFDCDGYRLGASDCSVFGSIIANTASATVGTSVGNVANQEFHFADPAAHDYRLGVLSPAIGFVRAADFLAVPDYWKYMTTGIDCSVPVYTAEGARTAGAYPGTPLAMVVTCGSADGSGTTTNAVTSAGQMVTVTATDADKRPFIGFEVNGVTNLTTETSWTFAPSAEPGAITVVRALYSFDLFVDANSPAGEGGNGLSWTTAFNTLAKAAAKAQSGDTIHVAEGVYDRGSMLQTEALIGTNTAGGVAIRCRVLVPSGVTLKAEGSVERTVIRGASATTDADAYGNGPDAIRCVALEADAKVVGFTLTGGRTAKEGAYDIDDTCGGAVIGVKTAGKSAGYDVCEVVGCIVSNDWAHSAGAGEYCRFVRSCVFDCGATELQSVGRHVRFNSCVFDRCRGNGAIMNFYEFDSCTVGGDITATGGSTGINFLAHPFRDGRPVVNSIFLCTRVDADANWKNSPFIATNCVFFGTPESSFATNWSTYTVLDRCVWTTKDVSTLLTADHRPVPGVFTEALDRGDETISEGEALAGTDLTGFPRVTNGARDIGALEADWRPRYGKDIGGRVTVTDSSWNVVEQDGKVTVPGGAAIAFTVVNRGSVEIDGVLNVTVGGGTLSVTLDDDPVAFGDPSAILLTVEPGVHKVTVSLAGGATDTAIIESFKRNVGGLLIIR